MSKETVQSCTHKPISPLLDLLLRPKWNHFVFNTDKPFLAETSFKKNVQLEFLMKLNVFNTDNKEERGRGQRSVV